MNVDQTTITDRPPRSRPIREPRRRSRRGLLWRRRRPRRRLRKLRILSILLAFGTLAVISVVFGMLTAVASDLPGLTVSKPLTATDTFLYDDHGRPIGVLAPPGAQVIDQFSQISPWMRRAIVAVEDRRFWTDPGIDLRGLIRAALADVTGGARQGASTIAEQFVKVTEQQQNHRTIFEKLREAALAFQLVQHWPRSRILTDYLNRIYFGSGAYGVESAARTYFGDVLGYDVNAPGSGRCGDRTPLNQTIPKCAQLLDPAQAALLAGMVADPTAFNPVLNAPLSLKRRNTVLLDMYEQGYLTRAQYEDNTQAALPKAADLAQPSEPAAAPYFTAWVRPQIVHALQVELRATGIKPQLANQLAQYDAYYGGLRIRLSLDLQLQQAAQDAINAEFPPGSDGPTATLVAIDNATGEVRAMVSGDDDFAHDPFNLAVEGERQPGSSFKVFTLAAALTSGKYGPDSVIDSQPLTIHFRGPYGEPELFPVHNFGNVYSGPISLAAATAESDNSVFAQVGMDVGTNQIKKFARKMGIRTPISTNPAMILGGLSIGVSALDMAHAYETVATGGLKVYNKLLGDTRQGPIGIHAIDDCGVCSPTNLVNKPTYRRVLSPEVAATIRELLNGVVTGGTGTQAAIPGVFVAGKTGTTTNYVDAWFVGWTPQLTTAVWVGYPNRAVPMLTQWQGTPVEGGTFPAVIWRNFNESAIQILSAEAAGKQATVTTPVYRGGSPAVSATPSTVTPTTATNQGATTTPAGVNGAATPAGNGTAGAGQTGGGAAAAGTGATAGGTGATAGGTGATAGGTGATAGGTGATAGGTGATAGGTGATAGGTGATAGGTGATAGGTGATGSTGSGAAGAPSAGGTQGSGGAGGTAGASGGAGLGGG
jgi:penicillin-binding protein 1A